MSWTAVAIGGAALVGGAASAYSGKKAAEASERGNNKAIAATTAATEQARDDVNRLFPQAQRIANQGFKDAQHIFQQMMPMQQQAFQGGNMASQQAILAGMPQIQNALLGGNIDYSAFQPYQAQTPDYSMFDQQLPSIIANQHHQDEMARIKQGAMLSPEVRAGIRQDQYNQATGMGNRILELSGIPQAGSDAARLWDKARMSPMEKLQARLQEQRRGGR